MSRNEKILWGIFCLLGLGLVITGGLLIQKLMTNHSSWWDWFLPMLFIYTMFNEWRILRHGKK
jgi:1-acyl-sn-glycerol-3-phosphate acyltransferase